MKTSLHKKLFAKKYVELTDKGVSIFSKSDHWTSLWRFIHWFLKIITFNQMTNFYTSFTTTIGKNIAFHSGWSPISVGARDYVILCHEEKHVEQYIKFGLGNVKLGVVVMGFLYLFVFIPVVGAWFRYYFEREAYLAGIRAWQRLGKDPDIELYVDVLTGPNYVWAWPFKKSVRKYFKKHLYYYNEE